MKAIRKISATGEITELNGAECSLEQAQEAVKSGTSQGWIEPVPIPPNNAMALGVPVMLVHEEGRLNRLPLNAKASEIACQCVVGDVLIIEWEKKDR